MNNITKKDLMVGDWVYYKDKKQMPYRVTSIVGNYIRFDDGTPQDWMVDVKNFTPIPLTAEILEKNGFWCEHDVGYVTEEYEYEIIYSTWNHELRILKNREQILKLKYFDEMCVHELQHAMRLAGIDKEITI